MNIIKYQGIENVAYIEENGKLKGFVTVDRNNERINDKVFNTATLAKKNFDQEFKGLV